MTELSGPSPFLRAMARALQTAPAVAAAALPSSAAASTELRGSCTGFIGRLPGCGENQCVRWAGVAARSPNRAASAAEGSEPGEHVVGARDVERPGLLDIELLHDAGLGDPRPAPGTRA